MADESQFSEDQKLQMLGLTGPLGQSTDAQGAFNILADIFNDWDTFKSELLDADLESWDEFETWLVSKGVSEDDAETIRNAFEDQFGDWDDFIAAVEDAESFSEFSINFEQSPSLESGLEDEDGDAVAGIRVFETAGTGKEGQSIPAGGVEIFGDEIHTSSTTPSPDTDPPGDDDGGSTYKFTYSNLTVSDTVVVVFNEITVSVDISNPSTNPRSEVVQFYEDGEVIDWSHESLPAGSSTTVTFEWGKDGDYGDYDLHIGPLDPIEVAVIHNPPSI